MSMHQSSPAEVVRQALGIMMDARVDSWSELPREPVELDDVQRDLVGRLLLSGKKVKRVVVTIGVCGDCERYAYMAPTKVVKKCYLTLDCPGVFSVVKEK